MKYFLGLVPPESYKSKIMDFQKQWKNNALIDVVEPHITVKAQGGLNPDLKWLEDVKKVCEHFQPFRIQLDRPGVFGESVVFLSVRSKRLGELHQKLVKAISPGPELIKRYMEQDDFHAHLTLGQTYFGLSGVELKQMAVAAERELSPYPTFEVGFIRVFQEVEPDRYQKDIDIPLGGA